MPFFVPEMKSQYPIIISVSVLIAIIIGVVVSVDTTQSTEVIVEQKISDLNLNEIQSISKRK